MTTQATPKKKRNTAPKVEQAVSELQARIDELNSRGLIADTDFVVFEYAHGYIDVYTRDTGEDIWEFRPNGTEIVRDHRGKEVT